MPPRGLVGACERLEEAAHILRVGADNIPAEVRKDVLLHTHCAYGAEAVAHREVPRRTCRVLHRDLRGVLRTKRSTFAAAAEEDASPEVLAACTAADTESSVGDLDGCMEEEEHRTERMEDRRDDGDDDGTKEGHWEVDATPCDYPEEDPTSKKRTVRFRRENGKRKYVSKDTMKMIADRCGLTNRLMQESKRFN